MDATCRVFDVRPYAAGERCTRVLSGHAHNFEKLLLRCAWSPDGGLAAAGSSDRNLYVWDEAAGELVYRLPGHKGSVNAVAFHPFEPIVASASSDKNLYLGEIER